MEVTSPGKRIRALALVATGGALGSLLRHGFDLWVPGWPPFATLSVNVLGAFLLGVVLFETPLAERFDPSTRLLVGTGFCGSLTTYSTFAAETVTATPALAGTYVLATYVLGFAAILAGRGVARWHA